MKFFRICLVFLSLGAVVTSCKKNTEPDWKISIDQPKSEITLTDISRELYDPQVSLATFKEKYPWFQGSVPDADFEVRRKDPAEINVYKEAVKKIDQEKLRKELTNLFAHIQHYFPQFKNPQVYLYSSALQSATDPVLYQPEGNLLFIDITGFMGENNPYYKGIDQYIQRNMTPKNILPKVTEILAEQFVPFDRKHQKFIDRIIYQGKIMILEDAFIPEEPNYLKINYSPDQYDWALANEGNIWDYFVENNLVFSDDSTLSDRFIAPGPFSKFYTAVDNESSPQIGIFMGWQICKEYFLRHPDTQLRDFLQMDAETIFKEAQYQPSETE